MRWFELCAAASGPLTIHALIPLAADSRATALDVERTARAYFPNASALSVLADHLLDIGDDARLGAHNYLTYYEGPQDLAEAFERLTATAVRDVRAVKRGAQHAVVVAAMVGMFFSDPVAQTGPNVAASRAALQAAGRPARVLAAVVRLIRWRDRLEPAG